MVQGCLMLTHLASLRQGQRIRFTLVRLSLYKNFPAGMEV
jgi:hypothetical protein